MLLDKNYRSFPVQELMQCLGCWRLIENLITYIKMLYVTLQVRRFNILYHVMTKFTIKNLFQEASNLRRSRRRQLNDRTSSERSSPKSSSSESLLLYTPLTVSPMFQFLQTPTNSLPKMAFFVFCCKKAFTAIINFYFY